MPACCREMVHGNPTGNFCAGLEFLESTSAFVNNDRPPISADPSDLDYYEVLQLSPNADAETINRVYRLLAQRYHPDHGQMGNSQLFIHLSEAYHVLSDPEKRAGYDARHRAIRRLQWKIFDQGHAAAGRDAEKRKRQGVLGLLYAKALHDPDDCAMSIQSIEDLLGCPREHLKATLWYLRGKGWITRSDNGRYSVTVEGFDEIEKHDVIAAAPASRQLPDGGGGDEPMHLHDDDLDLYVAGRITEAESAVIRTHVTGYKVCERRLAETVEFMP